MRQIDQVATPGGPLRAADLNELHKEIKRSNQLSIEGGTLTQGPSGPTISVDKGQSFYAAITATGPNGFHSWEERRMDLKGGWLTPPNPRRGGYNAEAAKEINGGSVTTGTVVELKPGGNYTSLSGSKEKFWTFSYSSSIFEIIQFVNYVLLYPDNPDLVPPDVIWPISVPIGIGYKSGAKPYILPPNLFGWSSKATLNSYGFRGEYFQLVNGSPNGSAPATISSFLYYLQNFVQMFDFKHRVIGSSPFYFDTQASYLDISKRTKWYYLAHGTTKIYPDLAVMDPYEMYISKMGYGYALPNYFPGSCLFYYRSNDNGYYVASDPFNLVSKSYTDLYGKIPCLVQFDPRDSTRLFVVQARHQIPGPLNYVAPVSTIGGGIGGGISGGSGTSGGTIVTPVA
jgi:hypothetical protein